jgi:hypothetical protein
MHLVSGPALLGVGTPPGAARIETGVPESETAAGALARTVILEKFHGRAAHGTSYLEDIFGLPVHGILAGASGHNLSSLNSSNAISLHFLGACFFNQASSFIFNFVPGHPF